MPPILLKEVLVEIRHSLGRFLSILAIVALGASFFAGIKASVLDMKASADTYFDSLNLQDIQVYSTAGLDDEDVQAIEKLPGVEAAQGQFSMDALTRRDSREMVVKVIGLQEDQKMNTPRLAEGRLPREADECVIQMDSATGEMFGTFGLRDRIRLYSGTDDPLGDSLNESTFIIVGKAYNPNYLSYELGTSSIGSGSVDTFIYVPQDAIKADYYTEVDVKVTNADRENTYSSSYFALTDPVVDELEDIADEQVTQRIARQREKLEDAKKELASQLAGPTKELAENRVKLEQAADNIASGAAQIASNESLLYAGREELEDGYRQYYSGKAQIESGLKQVDAGIEQLEAAQARLPELKNQLEQLKTAVQMLPMLNNAVNTLDRLESQWKDLMDQLDRLEEENPDDPAIAEIKAEIQRVEGLIDQAIAEFTGQPDLTLEQAMAWLRQSRQEIIDQIETEEHGKELIAQLEEGIQQIEELQSQLDELKATRASLLNAQSQLTDAYQRLSDSQLQLSEGQLQLEQARKELEAGQKEYDDGMAQFEEGEKEFNDRKDQADSQIADAEKQLDDLEGRWIILDRNSHYSYRDYQSCADRMDGIASVFPVFFYLVAALVCMTTMTRMVDEERNAIGTLKALGYSKGQIAFKYLAYAGTAAILGSLIGCAIGMIVFPYIIFSAWNTLYTIDHIVFTFDPALIATASLSVTGIVLLATIYSIARELKEVPSQLMRPKAAQAGKKILLERLPWLWKKVPFMHKVTLRNIFRYKKRFFMTTIGVAGCSALLVAGLGLKDSISSIVSTQYEEIYHYNTAVSGSLSENPDLKEQIEQTPGVKEVYEEQSLPITMNIQDKDQTGTLHIVQDQEALEDFVTFMKADNRHEVIHLQDEGVFVSVQAAERMNLSTGDTITFETTSGEEVKAPVAGIFEQYVGHQIYVTQKLFDSWNLSEPPNSSFLLINESEDPELENELGSALMELDGITSITFFSAMKANFIDMISSIKMVVVVLVLSAAALAFVVLYNLSNVNISERTREIATIEVLGFTEKEVNQYVNRETLLLAAIGALAGLVLGIWLHGMIMNLAEMDDIRFGRTILPSSFVIAFVLTMVFALGINWIMKFRLRKIEMVESLKAVE